MRNIYLGLIIGFVVFASYKLFGLNGNEPWTAKELLSAADLAKTINDEKAVKPLILSIGPSGLIKSAVDIGSADDEENLEKIKNTLKTIDKNKEVVIYCGCCPFDKCPNIRPAFNVLKEMNFTNRKLLNIPKNLKTDWIDKGFPTED